MAATSARRSRSRIATAGRAIFFSGLTVLIGLSGLALFDFMFLRSVGIAGVVVVFFSVLAALTLLPAVLGVVGAQDRAGSLYPAPAGGRSGDPDSGSRLSRRVMARPVAGARADAGAAPAARGAVSPRRGLVAGRDDPAARSPVPAGVRHPHRRVRPRGDFAVRARGAVADRRSTSARTCSPLYDLAERLRQDPRVVARAEHRLLRRGRSTGSRSPAAVALRRGATTAGHRHAAGAIRQRRHGDGPRVHRRLRQQRRQQGAARGASGHTSSAAICRCRSTAAPPRSSTWST